MIENKAERQLVARMCGDIGNAVEPFEAIAAETGMDEGRVLEILSRYRETGIMRRMGAILRHHSAGYRANGMSVWNVPDADAERIGILMAGRPEISHCYERARFDDWPYNLYGMIHGQSREEVLAVAQELAETLGITEYNVLFSLREFKKTSMVYLADERPL